MKSLFETIATLILASLLSTFLTGCVSGTATQAGLTPAPAVDTQQLANLLTTAGLFAQDVDAAYVLYVDQQIAAMPAGPAKTQAMADEARASSNIEFAAILARIGAKVVAPPAPPPAVPVTPPAPAPTPAAVPNL